MIEVNWTLFIASGIFLVILVGLHKLLFVPLFGVLDERVQRTLGLREEASQLSRRYEESAARFDAQIKSEKRSGYQLVESVRQEALELSRQNALEARNKADALQKEARQKISREIETSKQKLSAEVDEIAGMIASRILERA